MPSAEPLLPEGGKLIRQMSTRRRLTRIGMEEQVIMEERKSSSSDFVAAVLCCFLSVTGGVALGGYIFPSDEQHPNANFRVAGMQIGLLAATISSWVAFLKSGVYCGVAGGIFPPVIALGSTYFKSIGPEFPHTIMFALPLITLVQGVLLFFVARLPLEQMVKGIPYVVFCGFLAGTGVVCIKGGLEMAAASPVGPEFLEPGSLAHWVPPACTAAVVYSLQQIGAPLKDLLFPLGLALLAVAFYASFWYYYGGIDLTAARDLGFLYQFPIPTSPSFYQVWTLQDFGQVQWHRFADSSFLMAIVNSFALSVLCIVEDLYGVVEATGIKIDMRKEIENTALMNLLSGACGAMPTNLVMSYSVTAHKSGASSRSFLLYLSIISTLFFLVADYILSLIPIMVPAAALIWVGISMCWDMLFHGFWKLSRVDYLIVLMMVVLDVTQGPDVMLISGLCVTCLQLAYRLSSIEVLDGEHTSKTERSNTLYPAWKDKFLQELGTSVMILHLAKGMLFFGSAFQIQEKVEDHVTKCHERSNRLRFLVLDMTQIEYAEISGIKVLHFIKDELAPEHTFEVMLVGLQKQVEKQLDDFAGASEKRHRHLNDALRDVESRLFDEYRGDSTRKSRGTNMNEDLGVVRSDVRQVIGESEVFSVAVDVHSWLNNYTQEYVAQDVLPCLVASLTIKKLPKDEVICVTALPGSVPNIVAELDKRSPLIWVLSGRVDLVNCTFRRDDPEGKFVEQDGAGFKRGGIDDIVQIAEVDSEDSDEPLCAGPLDTFRHFFGAMQVPAVKARVYSEEATVALLSYSAFDKMPRSVANMLSHYTTKKAFVASAMSRR